MVPIPTLTSAGSSGQVNPVPEQPDGVICPDCQRQFKSRRGLKLHLRKCDPIILPVKRQLRKENNQVRDKDFHAIHLFKMILLHF